MLSVRLPEPLANQLAAYCETVGVSKSSVVQAALAKHLRSRTAARGASAAKRAAQDPLLALIGTGNRQFSTDQLMRLTRGDDWHTP